MKRLFALSLLLLGIYALEASAQTLLAAGDKIPEDLLITLKRYGGWGRQRTEITINAKGEFSVQAGSDLPLGAFPLPSPPKIVFINGRQIKNPRYLKPKVSAEKLRQLVAEFDRIEFFRFGEDFPQEDEKNRMKLTDQQTETISIRINGQFKEVSNYLGDNLNRTRILRDLAERIRGAGIWNYENDEIPEVFEIMYRVTSDSSRIEREFIIDGQGRITEKRFWTQASPTAPKLYATYPLKTKTVGKFSKQKLRELMDEFEKANFSTFRYSLLTKYAGCANEAALNEHKRTHIHVQINHIQQLYATLYKECGALPGTDAAKFEYINGVIRRMLGSVRGVELD